MTDLIGGALMIIGGGSLSAVALIGAKPRSALDRARDMLGDSEAAVVKTVPADMQALLDRLN